jgi:dihydrofolate reductase
VAASLNNVIGVAGGLPWRLPEDLRRFKQITMGKPIVMGRATWDSIGRALPGRQNIVISRQPGFTAAGCEVAASVDEALQLAGDAAEVMIIGGGTVYRQLLPRVNRIYLTRVDTVVEGDTFFPVLEASEWREVARESYPASGERQYGFDIQTLQRRQR